ncbi:helix-turn-helix transcriptional regulator [Streptomyces sp. Ru62]|uniref:helix-turn-helix transcriptional regulator n=1 Tax=Streptomyces sp. Ru62 TaxID=2080745 RepID=UPI000CDD8C13|nr:helix-turn-helix transcriptional regulator [Streptomyces sp. Ru62]POX64567.1 helix-turn-helix transcriptional regulator [Streptomyces sp. Ru62]
MDGTPDSPWPGTGLDPLAGRVLEYLVSVPSADTVQVAAAVGVPGPAARDALRQLEEAALALRVDGVTARWAAGPPRASLGALLARRRAELARAEALVERLHETYEEVSAPRAAHLVEALEHEEEVAARYGQLLKGTSAEVLHLAKPPYVTGRHTSAREVGVADGVRMRSVYETDGFTDAVSLETALRGTAEGGQLRLASRLPVKLVVFDRAAALLPVRGDRPTAGSLVVHSPALVEALVALFESVWERAEPVSLATRRDGPPPSAPRPEDPAPDSDAQAVRPDRRTREILHLMATGMKDDTIARVLKVSRRTVQKHVSEAGTLLGARTRFQIALLAAERGWLEEQP